MTRYNYNNWSPPAGDVKVPILKHIDIIRSARKLASGLRLNYPINCENMLNILSDNDILEYEVIDDEKLPNADAITNKTRITLRSSVIDAIGDNNNSLHNRHRFTVCHELGHVFLHNKVNYGLARATPPKKPYESAEAQANAFAGYLLVPFQIVKAANFDATEVMEKCCVSWDVASNSISNYKRLIENGYKLE